MKKIQKEEKTKKSRGRGGRAAMGERVALQSPATAFKGIFQKRRAFPGVRKGARGGKSRRGGEGLLVPPGDIQGREGLEEEGFLGQ